eukprot:1027800-Rhodomonas_salina.1
MLQMLDGVKYLHNNKVPRLLPRVLSLSPSLSLALSPSLRLCLSQRLSLTVAWCWCCCCWGGWGG